MEPDMAVRRGRDEFSEMPGRRLAPARAARAWGVEQERPAQSSTRSSPPGAFSRAWAGCTYQKVNLSANPHIPTVI